MRRLLLTLLLAFAPILASAQTFNMPIGPNEEVYTGAITTAATTQLLGASNATTYVYWLGVQAQGSESAASVNFETSPVAGCASNVTLLSPTGETAPAAGSAYTTFISGGNMQNVMGAYAFAASPSEIPPNTYLCMVTAGTTINLSGIVWYRQIQ